MATPTENLTRFFLSRKPHKLKLGGNPTLQKLLKNQLIGFRTDILKFNWIACDLFFVKAQPQDKTLHTETEDKDPQLLLKRILYATETPPATFQPATVKAGGKYLDNPYQKTPEYTKVLLLQSQNYAVIVNAQFHKFIMSRFPKAIPLIYDGNCQVYYKENDEVVAVLMPYNVGEGYYENEHPLHSKLVSFED